MEERRERWGEGGRSEKGRSSNSVSVIVHIHVYTCTYSLLG